MPFCWESPQPEPAMLTKTMIAKSCSIRFIGWYLEPVKRIWKVYYWQTTATHAPGRPRDRRLPGSRGVQAYPKARGASILRAWPKRKEPAINRGPAPPSDSHKWCWKHYIFLPVSALAEDGALEEPAFFEPVSPPHPKPTVARKPAMITNASNLFTVNHPFSKFANKGSRTPKCPKLPAIECFLCYHFL